MTDDELNTFWRNIIERMTGNVNFPTPVPSLESLTTSGDAFSASLTACLDGGRKATLLKNQNRETLLDILRELAQYVQLNCKNDPAIVVGAGFTVKKDSTLIGTLAKPQNVRVIAGPVPGSVEIRVNALHGAESYIYQYALVPANGEPVWETKFGGKSNIILKGLAPRTDYLFRVAGKGASDDEVFSDVVTFFVL